MAAMNIELAGNVSLPEARLMVKILSSVGFPK